jgi:hypothetical protein
MSSLTDNTGHIQDVLKVADASGINPKHVIVESQGLKKTFCSTPETTHNINDLKEIVALRERVKQLENKLENLTTSTHDA